METNEKFIEQMSAEEATLHQEKKYTLYRTADKRIELVACYATSTVYVLCQGEITDVRRNCTLSELGRMVDNLEEYDRSTDPTQELIHKPT